MAITVGKLFGNGTVLYKMKLLAGQKGLNNLVEWVHIIEDDDVSKFLHGKEVVFTAGILNQGGDWLLDYTRRLYEVGTSAFVVNIGPYTKEVPESVIHFCDEVDMPLYTIPWETRMVDITRDVCSRIIKREQVEISVGDTIKNIIFQVGDLETHVLQMERYGYQRDSSFCFIVMSFGGDGESMDTVLRNRIRLYSEKIARSIHELHISFWYNECLVLLLVNYGNYDIENFVETFLGGWASFQQRVHIGISENLSGFKSQPDNFQHGLTAMGLARNTQRDKIYYSKLDIHKLLLNIRDQSLLRQYYADTLGKLEEYDRENGTELMNFLKMYLHNNGSQSMVAQKQYIHRNTVTNQLKKIEKITGINPSGLEEKLRFYLGLYISELLD